MTSLTRHRIEGIPHHDGEIEKNDKLQEEQAREVIFGSQYAMPDIGVDSKDPLGFQAGEEVYVEPTDADPGAHPQHGKLIGLSTKKIVIELENGLRIHFPRIGYIAHRSTAAEAKSLLQQAKEVVGL